MFFKESTGGTEAGQVNEVEESYTMQDFKKTEQIIDYDDEELREEEEKRNRQCAN